MTDSVQIFPPGFRLVDTSGTPYSGATVELYDAGTTTPKLAYSDQALTTSLGSVIYTDSAGYPVASSGSSTKVLVYVDTDDYKIVVKDGDGATIATHDNIKGAVISGGSGEEAAGITQAQGDARYVRNPNALSAESNVVDTDILTFWDASASANVGITWANVKANLASEGVVLEAGTKAIFYQGTAPTGWTRDVSTTALNDAAIRILTTGSGAGTTGGTSGFTTVFASRTLTQGNLPSYTLPNTLSLSGSQSGGLTRNFAFGDSGRATGGPDTVDSITFDTTTLSISGSVTSGGSGTALDFAVKYANFIICTKD